MPLQLRRGLASQRASKTYASGELVYITDTGALYVGNGVTAGGVAIANLPEQDIKDFTAAMFTGGSHTGITFSYNSTTKLVSAAVDIEISNYAGTIRADAFKGTLVGEDSTILVDALAGKINLNGTVQDHIVPNANIAYDLGSSSFRFRDLYLSGSSIKLGSATITASGSAVNLPAGSTVNGVVIGTGTGTGDGVIAGMNYNINIVGDDSTLMLNARTRTITAAGGFVGDLSGNTFGNASTATTLQNTRTINSVNFNGSANISINTLINGLNDISLESNGNLTLADGVEITSSTSGAISYIKAAPTKNIGITTFNSSIGVSAKLTGVDIYTFGSSTTRTWSFGNDGILTLPGNGTISSAGGLVNIPAGSTIGGVAISTATQVSLGDYTFTGAVLNIGSATSTLTSSNSEPFEIKTLTTGVSGGIPFYGIKASKGTVAVPTTTAASDKLGGFNIQGYAVNTFKSAATFFAEWESTATLSDDNPGSKLSIITGNNAGGVNMLTYDSKGVLSAPIFKATSYATGSLPTSPVAGWIVYDSTTNEFKGYRGGGSAGWVVLG
jgi:hypothetical protein